MKKIFAKTFLAAVIFGVFGAPLTALAGGCRCYPAGSAVRASRCEVVGTLRDCQVSGKALSATLFTEVDCRYYTDDLCQSTAQSFRLTPTGGGALSEPGSVNIGADGKILPAPPRSSGSSTIEFPKPTLQIPEINIKIPGLTNFQEPRPTDCPASLQNVGITSCRSFPWLGQYLSALYKFGTAIAAFLAVVMVMWGGFLYITASGLSAQAEKGKEAIQMAFLGLVIVLSSYVLLFTINPALVTFEALKVPDVPITGPQSLEGESAQGVVQGQDQGQAQGQGTGQGGSGSEAKGNETEAANTMASPAPSTSGTAPLPKLPWRPNTSLATEVTCPRAYKITPINYSTLDQTRCVLAPSPNGMYKGVKDAKLQPGGRRTDHMSPRMRSALETLIATINGDENLRKAIGSWQINEAWPSTVEHDAKCHQVGCALDLQLLGPVDSKRVKAMDALLHQLYAQKMLCNSLNEYTYKVRTSTGDNFHIEAYDDCK